jgi:hypothetical protein
MEISKKTRGLRRACDAAAMLDLTPAFQTRWPTAPKALARGDVALLPRHHAINHSLFKSLSGLCMSAAAASPVYNFSAGPACLPAPVLLQVQAELLDFQNTGARALQPAVFAFLATQLH